MISDLIGVLYFVFHCTYDDQVDRRNSGVRTVIERNSGNSGHIVQNEVIRN